MRFLATIIWAAIGVVLLIAAVLFMIGTREIVELRMEFVPQTLELPLFAAILAAIVVGFIAGALVMWISDGRWRDLARDEMVEIDEQRQEIDRLKQNLAEARAAADKAEASFAAGADPINDNRQLTTTAGATR